MTKGADPIETTSVSDFEARCSDWLRAVEDRGVTLRITRHDKVVATISPSESEETGPTMDEWIGSGVGLMSENAASLFDEPTWEPGDWTAEEDERL